MRLSDDLKEEYTSLYKTMRINQKSFKKANDVAKKIYSFKDRYQRVAKESNIPWEFIGIIHSLEASLNFSKNLHNGQPWNQRTTLVPVGKGPFGSWEEAAIDAMVEFKNYNIGGVWDVAHICYAFERYNGMGYRIKNHTLSPYLWSFSNHYVKGKYVERRWPFRYSVFDSNLVSKQVGAMVLYKLLKVWVPELPPVIPVEPPEEVIVKKPSVWVKIKKVISNLWVFRFWRYLRG